MITREFRVRAANRSRGKPAPTIDTCPRRRNRTLAASDRTGRSVPQWPWGHATMVGAGLPRDRLVSWPRNAGRTPPWPR